MSLDRIIVHLGPLDGFYTFLPEMSIASFEALGIGDKPFTYEHVRKRVGWCWECDRPIWAEQDIAYDEDADSFHEGCYWDRLARREFEANLYKPRFIVTVWECDREMGGPEEGGWSYETGTLVCKVEVSDADAASYIQTGFEIEYPYTGKRGYYSKREPDFSVRIIDRWEPEVWHDMLDERLEPVSYYPIDIPYYC